MIPITWYLFVAALLFSIGLFGVFSRRSAVGILMAVELMLNAVNINLVAFWRYGPVVNPTTSELLPPTGWAWAIFVLTVAAAEAAVGLALIISVYRRRDSIVADELDLLKN